jgi:uncharacterized protein
MGHREGMIDRRAFLKASGAVFLGASGLGVYSVAIEPNFFLDVARYRVTPAGWPAGLSLRITVIADLHACEPWMPAARVEKIARVTNSLQPDMTVLLGDFAGGTSIATGPVTPQQWGEALSGLHAPLGVHAVLGNHDWWHGALPHMRGDGGESIRRALRQMGASVMENDVLRLTKDGQPFWLIGLADQMTEWHGVKIGFRGHDDLDGALAKVTDERPVIMLAHEPHIFRRTPRRVALTLSGHTHGGQVYPPFIGPMAAKLRFGATPVYGHVVKDERHIVVSAGLGESTLPVRYAPAGDCLGDS